MKFSNLTFLLYIIIFSVTVSSTNSQCPFLYIFTGESEGDAFGASVASAGDVNNDGYDDFVIGAPFAGGIYSPGQAYVLSGLTGDTLYVLTGETDFDGFGGSVAGAGDVNNDGFDDVIIGANTYGFGGVFPGRAYVFSGKTGNIIYEFPGQTNGDRFGSSVASAGDVNNDGFDDIIVGARWNDGGGTEAGRAYVFSGQGDTVLHVFTGEAASDKLGWSVASAGDVNNDGFADMIVGAPANDAGGSDAGRAYVFSGQTGDTIFVFSGEAEHNGFGYSVASAGDVNNDGFSDIIVGAYVNDAGGLFAGRAYVFSGLNGDTLHVFTGEAENNYFGISVASAGDVNNDGFADLIVGASLNSAGGDFAGRAYVFSGQTGDRIYVFTGEAAQDGFGNSVASAGDVDNDGIADLIVGASGNDAGGVGAGRAYVFSGKACLCADANGDLLVNVDDVAHLMNYYFYSGTSPVSLITSDLNCDGSVNIADITYLAAYINGTGAAPCCEQ